MLTKSIKYQLVRSEPETVSKVAINALKARVRGWVNPRLRLCEGFAFPPYTTCKKWGLSSNPYAWLVT